MKNVIFEHKKKIRLGKKWNFAENKTAFNALIHKELN
jgi:hypothetical protein